MKKIILMMFVALTLNGLTGCKKEGPLEQAGKDIDQAVEKAGDKIEDATDTH